MSNKQFSITNSPQSTFSIVTPSYNQLDWLRLCVASVRDQAALNVEGGNLKAETKNQEPRTKNSPPPLAVEHIIQDAGTPGIEDFAREINADFYRDGKLIFSFSASQNFSISRYRIAIHCERDAGMYDAINRGLARASGELCAYLNCDDQFLPGTLSRVANYFHENPDVEMLFGDVAVVDTEGNYLCSRLVTIPSLWHTITCTLSIFTAATFFRTGSSEQRILFPSQWKAIGDAAWIVEHLKRGTKMALFSDYLSAATETGENLILSERGQQEIQSFVETAPAWARRFKKLFQLDHRVRRLLRGGYSPKPFEYSIFTRESPGKRKQFEVGQATFRLPGRFG